MTNARGGQRLAHAVMRSVASVYGWPDFHPIVRASVAAVKEAGYSVTVEAPFAGALVPLASYRTDRRIWSVMIEVNRRLYMDEQSGLRNRHSNRCVWSSGS
jgi:N-formylglutamate amidohydrolase